MAISVRSLDEGRRHDWLGQNPRVFTSLCLRFHQHRQVSSVTLCALS
jgi:hypothetical protein